MPVLVPAVTQGMLGTGLLCPRLSSACPGAQRPWIPPLQHGRDSSTAAQSWGEEKGTWAWGPKCCGSKESLEVAPLKRGILSGPTQLQSPDTAVPSVSQEGGVQKLAGKQTPDSAILWLCDHCKSHPLHGLSFPICWSFLRLWRMITCRPRSDTINVAASCPA